MSKFSSYDDLPLDIAYKLQCLEFELQEGDITQKGYEKKKNSILAPYQALLEEKNNAPPLQLTVNKDQDGDTLDIPSTPIDFGPEPSAADVVDFLDFLPSPTHSPVDKEGVTLMQENHQQQTPKLQHIVGSPNNSSNTNSIRQTPPPLTPIRPQQQQFRPPYSVMPENYNRSPAQQQNWNPGNNVRPFDPRMGLSRPMYGNNYPIRPPMMNNFRPSPPVPPAPSSPINSSIYNRPPPQPFNVFRPPPSKNGTSTPTHVSTQFSQQHSRSPSLDSKPDYGLPYNIRQNSDVVAAPESVDWETSSTTWRPNINREPSIMSTPSRLRPSMSTSSALSNSTLNSSSLAVRRTTSSASRGRSRYRDSYMATTFKAIEPAPQPKLSLNDPVDQMFLSDLAGRQMTPLKGRSIPFPLIDGDSKTILTDFKNLAEVLRFRSTKSGDRLKNAFVLVDARGKESTSITWEKLNARAEKIAHQIKEKGKVKPGDRVALIYRKSEVLEFIPALFGCFLAGVTAVPINAAEDLSELSFILNLTNISLILTTDHNQRAFTKDMQAKSMELPASITWWKTNDIGTWYPPKKSNEYPPIKAPEIAYIEYAKASNGELKGVTVSHTSIMEQCAAFQASITESNISTDNGVVNVKPKREQCTSETVVSYFEPRQQIGLVLSVLQSVYAGYNVIFSSGTIIDTPAAWIYLLSKYKATMALVDYPALKFVTKFYQSNTKEVKSHSKKVTPDLSSLRNLIIDTNTIKPELNEYVADKLLRPLGNTDNPLEVVCPVLSLPEQGGKIISMRDNLGPATMEESVEHSEEEDGRSVITTQSVLAPGGSHDIFECLFDAQALKANKVMVLAAGDEARKTENINEPGRVRVEAFGFCMPNTTAAIVDPDTATLCPPDTLGEVWINSPSIANGFWALPKHSDSIFHARAIVVPSEKSYPEVYNDSFLRTGLSGTIIGGRLFILGSYEERVRQQRLGADFGIEDTYYTSDLLNTISKRARIDQCTIFEVLVKNQHLPIIVCESSDSKSQLSKIAAEIEDALIEFHGLRLYAIIFVSENGLPRQLIHGRRAIHQLLAKRYFLQGQLSIRHIKLDVDRTVFNLAANEDPTRDLWLSRTAYEKAIRSGAIIPHHQHQHTGMEKVFNVLDDRTEYDISRFANIVDILQWRTTMYPEEVSYTVSTQSGSNINTKTYTWRKLSYMSATVAAHLVKKGLKQRQKVLVMMPFGIDYIFSIYACLSIGVIPVPIEPVDPQQQPQRISEFSKQMVEVSIDLAISAIVTNTGGDEIMRHSAMKAAIKSNIAAKSKLPEIINISKATKHHKTLGKESGFMVRSEWISSDRNTPTIILIQNSSDSRRQYAYIGHDTILNQCRTQKMTCQMRSQRGIVTTGLGTYEGLGFLYALFCGVYVGSSTVLIPSADFYSNPASFFESLQRYKTKDAFLTNALVQFAMNRMNINDCRHITLKGVQNLMLANDNRPKPLLYQHMARYFARQRLEKETINTVYSHAANPIITTRSYMLMEPISLSIDPYWLRQGIVRSMGPEEEPYGILLNDSGIVPCNTMVAIVNPETRMVCPSNVVGEIWVSSDSNAKTFHNLDDITHNSRFQATIAGSDLNVKYMRTGDFGFLWNVRRRIDNRTMHPVLEEGQCLFVLGPVSETIIRNGLIHFPVDVELTMERCHPSIPSGGSIVFQIKDEVIAVVSTKASEHALSIVPLIVNTVLDNHSFLIDTIVIVHPNNFPRSRFGDKIRRKAMTSFVEKKLTAIYVKRITNQNESLLLPQWTQSQVSISEMNLNSDNMSIHTIPNTQSLSDFNSDFDKASVVQQLARQDTETSHRSHSTNHESVVQSPQQ